MKSPYYAQLGGYSYCWQAGTSRFVPWTGDEARNYLQDLLNQADVVVMHNQLADSMVLFQHGIIIPYDKLHDTLVMAYVLRKPELGLKALSNSELHQPMTELAELTGTGKNKLDPLDVGIDKLWPYACADADSTWSLYHVLYQQLIDTPNLLWVYENIERPLFPVVIDMQRNGVLVDWKAVGDLSVELNSVLALLQAAMRSITGRPISWGHSPSVQAYVYGDLGYPVQYTDDKTPTLDSKKAIPALRQIRDHPFLELLESYRHVKKIKGSYVDKLPPMADEQGYLHPSFKQFGTGTGRFSSEDPNIQQIPLRTELGQRVRSLFISPQGYDWLGVDYSQIELMTLTIVTQDPALVKIYSGQSEITDVHDYVTSITGVPRRVTKELTYGKMNGQGVGGAYAAVVKSYQEAGQTPPTWGEFKIMAKKHAAILPGLEKHQKTIAWKIASQGYIETYFGRREYYTKTRGEEFRSALSLPHQGTAADIMKLALPKVWQVCKEHGARLIQTSHDEVGVYSPEDVTQVLAEKIKTAMETVWPFRIPLKAEVKVGKNWESAH